MPERLPVRRRIGSSPRRPAVLPRAASLAIGWALVAGTARGEDPVDYLRDIKPLLSDRCYTCHGPDADARKGGFRLDVREVAVEEGVIVPGEPFESEIFERIAPERPRDRMPPPDSNRKPLTPEEVERIRRWVEAGAPYAEHWAWRPPVRPEVPGVGDDDWPRNEIDRFVLARLEDAGLEPSPPAGRRTLIRRVTLDLTGLPPAPEQVEAFLADERPGAWERLVDRLLASPHHGERLAIPWLDAVRYADTVGIHGDQPVSMSPYRDWVIEAFNEGMPYDRFVSLQVAGDLMPDAGREGQVASAFNRLHMMTSEGGAQPKEYLAKYAADRVRNTGTALLGSTFGCAECHDHKFDPFTSRDFYRFAAFFADLEEKGVYGGNSWSPELPVPTEEQEKRLAELDREIARVRELLETETPALAADRERWARELQGEAGWETLRPVAARSAGGAGLETLSDGSVLAAGERPERDTYTLGFTADLAGATGLRIEALPHASLPSEGPGRAGNGNFVLNEVRASADGEPLEIAAATASHAQDGWPAEKVLSGDGGWAILPRAGARSALVLELAPGERPAEPARLELVLRQEHGGAHVLGRVRVAITRSERPVRARAALPPDVEEALGVPAGERSDAQRAAIAAHHREVTPLLDEERKRLENLVAARKRVQDSVRTLVVSKSVEPRTMRVLPRGNWMDDSGDVVEPGVPAFLEIEPVEGRRATRRDLARWLVHPENPLVARVHVNRLWKLAFGRGIVATPDDFGSQGRAPSHPELLDWLAVELRESGWDGKHVLRLICTSSTYRQSSRAPAELRKRDPQNALLTRQGRFRLPAELVRDQALAASGLLVRRIGGRSVKPYQPEGYYAHLNFPKRTYQADHGPNQYRRGLYTHWQRTFLHPMLKAFDAPTREESCAARARSNTPLQSLVLLNDPSFVEAARALAQRMLREAGPRPGDRVRWLTERVLSRPPRDGDLETLTSLAEEHVARYRADPEAARALLGVGDLPAAEGIDSAELAGWTSAARVVLSLHETITRY